MRADGCVPGLVLWVRRSPRIVLYSQMLQSKHNPRLSGVLGQPGNLMGPSVHEALYLLHLVFGQQGATSRQA